MTLQTWPREMVDLVTALDAHRRQTAADVTLLGDVFIELAASDHRWQQCDCGRCALVQRIKHRLAAAS